MQICFMNEEIFKNKSLINIRFFQVNAPMKELNNSNQNIYFVDGGVELEFPNKNFLSFGWSEKDEHLDVLNDNFNSLYSKKNAFEITNFDINTLINKPIQSIRFKKMEFQFITDYTMQIKTIEQIVEINIELENQTKLNISAVSLDIENGQLSNLTYDLTGGILFSINQSLDIE